MLHSAFPCYPHRSPIKLKYFSTITPWPQWQQLPFKTDVAVNIFVLLYLVVNVQWLLPFLTSFHLPIGGRSRLICTINLYGFHSQPMCCPYSVRSTAVLTATVLPPFAVFYRISSLSLLSNLKIDDLVNSHTLSLTLVFNSIQNQSIPPLKIHWYIIKWLHDNYPMKIYFDKPIWMCPRVLRVLMLNVGSVVSSDFMEAAYSKLDIEFAR